MQVLAEVFDAQGAEFVQVGFTAEKSYIHKDVGASRNT
jgi:hypothetical protein